MRISDHSFRGGTACLYPVPTAHDSEDFELCDRPEQEHRHVCDRPEREHRDSVDERPAPLPHWFLGLRSCIECHLGFDHPAHYLAPSRVRLVGLR